MPSPMLEIVKDAVNATRATFQGIVDAAGEVVRAVPGKTQKTLQTYEATNRGLIRVNLLGAGIQSTQNANAGFNKSTLQKSAAAYDRLVEQTTNYNRTLSEAFKNAKKPEVTPAAPTMGMPKK